MNSITSVSEDNDIIDDVWNIFNTPLPESDDSEPLVANAKPEVTEKEIPRNKKLSPQEIEERNQRTVFIGNLPDDLAKTTSGKKKLIKLFSQMGEVESVRLRSIAFSEQIPRKTAFKQKKFHEKRHTLNAYLVFKDKEAVKKSLELNATVFMDRHIRVDSSANPAPHKHRHSVFVGNLPFDIEEEDIWSHFKSCGPIEYVRIVRDKATNIGKGFAYVQFKDSSSIEDALNLNKSKISDGRELRVQRSQSNKKKEVSKIKKSMQIGKSKKLKDIKAEVSGIQAKLGMVDPKQYMKQKTKSRTKNKTQKKKH